MSDPLGGSLPPRPRVSCTWPESAPPCPRRARWREVHRDGSPYVVGEHLFACNKHKEISGQRFWKPIGEPVTDWEREHGMAAPKPTKKELRAEIEQLNGALSAERANAKMSRLILLHVTPDGDVNVILNKMAHTYHIDGVNNFADIRSIDDIRNVPQLLGGTITIERS